MLLTTLRPTIGRLLDQQHNVVSRVQLLEAGVNDMTAYRRCRSGSWQRLLPGIYLIAESPPGTEQRRIAASLYAGADAQLTGLTILHWYGFKHAPSTDKIHVLVPHASRCRTSGFVIAQRTLALDPLHRDAGLYRITSPARAAIDACRALADIKSVRAILTEAVQAGHTSAQQLDMEIRRAARSRTALARRALTEIFDGVRSAPEAELREITLQSTVLPTVLWNAQLCTAAGQPLPTPDGWIPEVGVALEVDSAEHHSAPDDWRRTLTRHNDLSRYGVAVLHFTPSEIRRFPHRVLATIEETYLARRGSPAPTGVLTRAPS